MLIHVYLSSKQTIPDMPKTPFNPIRLKAKLNQATHAIGLATLFHMWLIYIYIHIFVNKLVSKTTFPACSALKSLSEKAMKAVSSSWQPRTRRQSRIRLCVVVVVVVGRIVIVLTARNRNMRFAARPPPIVALSKAIRCIGEVQPEYTPSNIVCSKSTIARINSR